MFTLKVIFIVEISKLGFKRERIVKKLSKKHFTKHFCLGVVTRSETCEQVFIIPFIQTIMIIFIMLDTKIRNAVKT